MRIQWQKRVLHFRRPAATSRGFLTERATWIIHARTAEGTGYGECCTMPGLLPEPTEDELRYWCGETERLGYIPAGGDITSPIRFGLECALAAAQHPGQPRWESPFTRGECGIEIHHLIWMSDTGSMLTAMAEGLKRGFRCLKLKVGALPFDEEIRMLREAHAAFPHAEIRVDANGAFAPEEAFSKLDALAAAGVSSIEQPLRPGQWEALRELCRRSPLPIAADEELITAHRDAEHFLDTVQPQALVIKPSLHGGFAAAQYLSELAEKRGIRVWLNSALESHIGLTALAEWCGAHAPDTLHGLGTGLLFEDDSPGRVQLRGSTLRYIAAAKDSD